MIEKINVQIKQGGQLIKEINEDNIIVITEKACGELFAHIGIREAAILAAQLSNEYDRMLDWISKSFRLDKEDAGDLVRSTKMHINMRTKCEVVIEPKEFGDNGSGGNG